MENYDIDVDKLEKYGGVEWSDPAQPRENPVKTTVDYMYKWTDIGNVVAIRERCSVKGDLMGLDIQFNSELVQCTNENETNLRLLFCIAAMNNLWLEHMDTVADLGQEALRFNNLIYVRKVTASGGTYLNGGATGKLHKICGVVNLPVINKHNNGSRT